MIRIWKDVGLLLLLFLALSGTVACLPSSDDGGSGEGHCADGKQNEDETDTDCGGTCNPCADGLRCATAADCLSGACGLSATCVPDTCLNNQQDGEETGVDCGGSCPGCFGEPCSANPIACTRPSIK